MGKKPVAPSVMAWKALISTALSLYKATYANRKVLAKFDNV